MIADRDARSRGSGKARCVHTRSCMTKMRATWRYLAAVCQQHQPLGELFGARYRTANRGPI